MEQSAGAEAVQYVGFLQKKAVLNWTNNQM